MEISKFLSNFKTPTKEKLFIDKRKVENCTSKFIVSRNYLLFMFIFTYLLDYGPFSLYL